MEQKKWKFNIVDVIVLVVLIAGIIFVGMRMFGSQDASAENPDEQTYRVSFFAEAVPERAVQYLKVGNSACNGDMNMNLGTVVELEIGESIVYTAMPDGTMAKTSKDGYCSVSIVCELTGVQEEIGLKVGTYYLLAGHYMNVRSGNSQVYCCVTSIEPVGE